MVLIIVPCFCHSNFSDIFDINWFIESVASDINVIKEPSPILEPLAEQLRHGLRVPRKANATYYLNKILPLLKKRHVPLFPLLSVCSFVHCTLSTTLVGILRAYHQRTYISLLLCLVFLSLCQRSYCPLYTSSTSKLKLSFILIVMFLDFVPGSSAFQIWLSPFQ